MVAITESRLKIVKSYDYDKSPEENHADVCHALLVKLGWKGKLVGGDTKKGMVWVFIDGGFSIVEYK